MIIKFVVFISLLSTIYCQKFEGDSCTVDNKDGICKPLQECTIAKDNLRKGIRPQICGFSSTGTVVCCPSENITRKPPTSPSYSAPSYSEKNEEECSFPDYAVKIKRDEYPQKSWNKCIDLADSIFPCTSPGFSLHAPKIRMSVCQHTAGELILGGTAAKLNEFPHMAVLGYENFENHTIYWDCGGTLISEKWVMTAAHCLYSRKSKSEVSHVRLGGGDLSVRTDSKFLFSIIDKVKHPEYKTLKIYNDIALLRLDRSVRFSKSIRPACLHVGNPVKESKTIAIGYGIMDNNTQSDVLMKVVLDKFSHKECSEKHPPAKKYRQGILDATQICYGSRNQTKDTCQGDSGGPLQIYNDGVHCTYTVIGITSTGQKCGVPGTPALYTRVSAFVPWIESVVWPN